MSGTLLVLVGPSGSGKTSLAGKLESNGVNWIRTCTTRPRRRAESDRDAIFVTEAFFKSKLADDELLSPAEFGGHLYGVPYPALYSAMTKNSVVVVEPSGVHALKEFASEHAMTFRAVYVDAPLDLRQARLKSEGQRLTRDAHAVGGADWKTTHDYDAILVNTNQDEVAAICLSLFGALPQGMPPVHPIFEVPSL